MKTLEEIKEAKALFHRYHNWVEYINDQPNYMVEKIMDEIAFEYAKQMCIEQKEICASHVKFLFHDGRSKKDKVLTSRIYIIGCDNLMIYKESITNAPLSTDNK